MSISDELNSNLYKSKYKKTTNINTLTQNTLESQFKYTNVSTEKQYLYILSQVSACHFKVSSEQPNLVVNLSCL